MLYNLLAKSEDLIPDYEGLCQAGLCLLCSYVLSKGDASCNICQNQNSLSVSLISCFILYTIYSLSPSNASSKISLFPLSYESICLKIAGCMVNCVDSNQAPVLWHLIGVYIICSGISDLIIWFFRVAHIVLISEHLILLRVQQAIDHTYTN